MDEEELPPPPRNIPRLRRQYAYDLKSKIESKKYYSLISNKRNIYLPKINSFVSGWIFSNIFWIGSFLYYFYGNKIYVLHLILFIILNFYIILLLFLKFYKKIV